MEKNLEAEGMILKNLREICSKGMNCIEFI